MRHYMCSCMFEKLFCYAKSRSFFVPKIEQYIIFAQQLDIHAFGNAELFLDRVDDDYLTFYYYVLEKAVALDSSYLPLFEYVKNKIVGSFVDYYRKGVKV